MNKVLNHFILITLTFGILVILGANFLEFIEVRNLIEAYISSKIPEPVLLILLGLSFSNLARYFKKRLIKQ